jgi:hypothetical protein
VILLIRNMFPVIPGFLCIMILAGCTSTHKDVNGRSFDICSLVKNDIDLVTETHQRVVFVALKDTSAIPENGKKRAISHGKTQLRHFLPIHFRASMGKSVLTVFVLLLMKISMGIESRHLLPE